MGIDGADFNLAIMVWPQPMYYTVEAEWIFFPHFPFPASARTPVPSHDLVKSMYPQSRLRV